MSGKASFSNANSVEYRNSYNQDTDRSISMLAGSLTQSVLGITAQLPTDRQGHRTDKNCICCNAKFGKIGIAHARKFRWQILSSKFCYRGVCRKCSTNRITHPERMIPTRICQFCYNDLLQRSTREKVLAQLRSAQDSKRELEQRFERSKSRNMQEEEKQVEELNKALQDKEEYIKLREERLQNQILKAEEEAREKLQYKEELENQYKEKEEELNWTQTEEQRLLEEISRIQEEYQDEQSYLEELQSEIKTHEEKNEEMQLTIECEGDMRIKENSRKVLRLKEQVKESKNNKNQLEDQLNQAKEELHKLFNRKTYMCEESTVHSKPSLKIDELEKELESITQMYEKEKVSARRSQNSAKFNADGRGACASCAVF